MNKEEKKDKVKNLKALIDQMDSKREFVEAVSESYSRSYLYTLQNWFQAGWKIPDEEIDNIITMAQKFLFEQTEKTRKLLAETGYKNQ